MSASQQPEMYVFLLNDQRHLSSINRNVKQNNSCFPFKSTQEFLYVHAICDVMLKIYFVYLGCNVINYKIFLFSTEYYYSKCDNGSYICVYLNIYLYS